MSGGGILVALGLLLGVAVGVYRGEATIGLLGGLAVGALAAVFFAIIESRRRRRAGERAL